MMSRHAQENLISVLLLALFAFIIVLCQDFGPRARMIPLPLAIIGILLTVLQMGWHNFASPEDLQMDMLRVQAPVAADSEKPAEAEAKKTSIWHEVGACAMVGLLLVLTYVAGVMLAAFLFTAGYFMVTRYCSWWLSLGYAAILTVSLYLLFEVALEMQPYYGMLAPLFN